MSQITIGNTWVQLLMAVQMSQTVHMSQIT